MAKLKDKERVLAHLISLRDPNTGIIYKPKHLLSSLRGVSREDFDIALEALEADGLIKVQYLGSQDEYDGIHTIQFFPAAFYEHDAQKAARREKWIESRRYAINTGISIASFIIAAIALLAQLGIIPLPPAG